MKLPNSIVVFAAASTIAAMYLHVTSNGPTPLIYTIYGQSFLYSIIGLLINTDYLSIAGTKTFTKPTDQDSDQHQRRHSLPSKPPFT